MKQALEAKDAALAWLKPVTREILKYYRKDMAVETKSDQSPVTLADRKAEEMLRRRIERWFPEHGIIGEEFGTEDEDREWVWTIDPIDGTRSFIRGLPLFATLLALLHRGRPVMGILCLPALGETAWAVKGHGAWEGGERLRVSAQPRLKGATLATGDIYCFRARGQMRLWRRLEKSGTLLRTYPDAFGHLMAVRGVVDAMVDPWAFIWDFAPCQILAEEAGGVFTNFSGRKTDLRAGSALVGNARIVRELKRLVAETVKPR